MKGQEEGKKKDYLIAKALHQFMWASILASVASQIAMTTDAIVVSQFIGPEAISAVNLTMPVVIFFNFLMNLSDAIFMVILYFWCVSKNKTLIEILNGGVNHVF